MDPGSQPSLFSTVSPSEYRRALSSLPTPVAVVTANGDDGPLGMVIGTFTSVSMEPPLVGFFGDHRSQTLKPLLASERLTFNVLRQEDLAVCEAFRLPAHERFRGIAWRTSEFGTPVLDAALLVVHTSVREVAPAGDHQCVLAEVHGIVHQHPSARPLVFYRHRLSRLDPGQMLDAEMWQQLGWADE